MIKGRIHSFESFGTVDGPGIRYVIFMQGCPYRCVYCHNPDTWSFSAGEAYSVDQVMAQLVRFKPYFEKSGGGVTVSGGEPLMQPDFLTALFKACKEEGIHTALDTSGYYAQDKNIQDKAIQDKNTQDKAIQDKDVQELLEYTDLVLLDIKALTPDQHLQITGFNDNHSMAFAKILEDNGIPAWFRYVVVPGLTDKPSDLEAFKNYVKTFKNVEKAEFLPFHKMGEYKWDELGIPYSLKETPPAQIITNE